MRKLLTTLDQYPIQVNCKLTEKCLKHRIMSLLLKHKKQYGFQNNKSTACFNWYCGSNLQDKH